MRASEPTVRALEFDSLRLVAAEFAANDLGRLALSSLVPFTEASELRRSLAMTAEVEVLLDAGALVVGFEEDLGPLGEAFARESAEIGGADLLLLARVLNASQEALARIRAEGDRFVALREAYVDVPDLADLVRELGKRLDERGRVRDNASRRLEQLARKSRKMRQGLYDKLGRFAAGHQDNLAEETVSVQDGRLVVLLRSGSKGRLAGMVQGRSSTGRSFYFEPLEFVEDNNELQSNQREEEAERQRILAELLRLVRSHAADLGEHWQLLGDLDVRQALCRLKQAFGGQFVEPQKDEELELVDARHPLLDPLLADHRGRALGQAGHLGPVVPLSLTLTNDRRMLVVTGPNAGGKTVALKTVGLLLLAAHCGFPVPVGIHSRLPFLESIVAVVGDDQDLLAERSTFSGKLLRLREVWHEAHSNSLVLIDELGSGTDPTEGAALGAALIEALADKGPWTLVTTHLTAIAARALDLERAECAAMEFDAGSGRPTYRLVPGPPGGSEALALARRLELPSEWLDRAEELLGPEERRLRRLLHEVETAKRRLDEDRDRLASALEQAERDRGSAAALFEEAQRERAQVSKKLKRELRDFRDEVRRKLAGETERLARELASTSKRSLASRAVERLFEAAPEFEEPPEPGAKALRAGEAVEHSVLGWRGELLSLDGEKATVGVHGKRVMCSSSELVRSQPKATGEREFRAPVSGRRAAVTDVPSGVVEELILIGQRVEPALEALDRFLDRALLGSNDSVRIVHGHGSGRLRRAVRDRLAKHPAVGSWRAGDESEGGDGATVVALA